MAFLFTIIKQTRVPVSILYHHTQTEKHMHVQTRTHKGTSDKALGHYDVKVLGQ